MPEDYLNTLFGDYSKILHHTHLSIMESYKYYADFSFLKAKEKRAGFRYEHAPFFGENVYDEYLKIVHQYQNLIQFTLMTFHIVFHKSFNLLKKETINFLKKNIEYYSSPLSNKFKL